MVKRGADGRRRYRPPRPRQQGSSSPSTSPQPPESRYQRRRRSRLAADEQAFALAARSSRVPLPLKSCSPPRFGGEGPAALPREPPFRRELTFVGVGQATWLIPRRGVTVAGQRRVVTGLRCVYAGRGICARHRQHRARRRTEPAQPLPQPMPARASIRSPSSASSTASASSSKTVSSLRGRLTPRSASTSAGCSSNP